MADHAVDAAVHKLLRGRRGLLGVGGIVFSLADSAFAFACNSRNEATVAAGCSIEFLRAVKEGETLTAIAEERVLSGRTGIYDIAVVDAAGAPVAIFRGKSARIKGEVLQPGE